MQLDAQKAWREDTRSLSNEDVFVVKDLLSEKSCYQLTVLSSIASNLSFVNGRGRSFNKEAGLDTAIAAAADVVTAQSMPELLSTS